MVYKPLLSPTISQKPVLVNGKMHYAHNRYRSPTPRRRAQTYSRACVVHRRDRNSCPANSPQSARHFTCARTFLPQRWAALGMGRCALRGDVRRTGGRGRVWKRVGCLLGLAISVATKRSRPPPSPTRDQRKKRRKIKRRQGNKRRRLKHPKHEEKLVDSETSRKLGTPGVCER